MRWASAHALEPVALAGGHPHASMEFKPERFGCIGSPSGEAEKELQTRIDAGELIGRQFPEHPPDATLVDRS